MTEILFQKGVSFVKTGNFQEALKCFDKVIEINPKSAEAWNNKAFILANLNKHEETIYCCDRAIEINPGYPDPWDIKSRVLGRLGRNDEAFKAIERFIELAPPEYAPRIREAKQALAKLQAMGSFRNIVTIGGPDFSKKERAKKKDYVAIKDKKEEEESTIVHKKKCRFCGLELPTKATFCASCGKKQPPKEKTKIKKAPSYRCEFCGTKLPTGAIFCASCGKKRPGREKIEPATQQRAIPSMSGELVSDKANREAERNNKNGLICGIIGIFIFSIILGPLAIYYGNTARNLDPSKGLVPIVLGVVAISIRIFFLIALLSYFATTGGG